MYIAYTFNETSTTSGVEDSNSTTQGSQTYNLGTLTTGNFTVTAVYLKCWDDWGSNYKSQGGLLGYTNKGGSNSELQSFSHSSKGNNSNDYEWKNTSANLNLASTSDASGNYTFVCWGKTWWTYGDGNNNTYDNYYPTTSNSNYTFNYTINPPAVSSFAVSTTGSSSILAGSGTNADPYIISYNGSLKLTLSGSKEHTDANSSLQYNTAGTWNTTTSRTISNITSTTATSVTVKMRCYNSSASLSGTESSQTIYYKAENRYQVKATTTVTGGSATPTSYTYMGELSGGSITATPSTGYSFSGWSILSGGGGYFGTSGTATTSTTANTTFRPTKQTDLKATFTAKTYAVTLNGNEGTNGTATATYNSTSLTGITHCSRPSYDLNGYYTDASGGTKIANADGTLTSSAVSV